MLKTMSVAFLALIAFAEGGPLLLVLALGFCAVGDAFLALSAKWLKAGMAAFAIGHALYIILFVNLGGGLGPDALRLVLQIGLIRCAFFLYQWLNPELGAMRAPVLGYFVIIFGMAQLALGLPHAHWLATLGALMFLASDALLAGELFRFKPGARLRRWSPYAVWTLYWAGQAAITAGVLYPDR
jgi:uncharacterized membrane protein YhhN